MTEPSSPSLATAQPEATGTTWAGKGGYGLLALAVLVLDQLSKWWVDARLPPHMEMPLLPGLNFVHVKNTGVAFGLFADTGRQGGNWLLAALGVLALGLVLVYFAQVPRQHRLLLTALALIVGGALGNLIDRVAAGAVTDFIDVYVGTYHWHTFNLADSGITIGIVLIAWDALRSHFARPRPEPPL
ncbi:MAG TPA: signal peptidase II [Thermoanaerobaculia bacterium]|nr:signal peptidase II [Thermoanaerobaculia bacterium]